MGALWERLAVCTQTKRMSTLSPGPLLLSTHPQKVSVQVQKDIYKCFQSSFIHENAKLEAMLMSTDKKGRPIHTVEFHKSVTDTGA